MSTDEKCVCEWRQIAKDAALTLATALDTIAERDRTLAELAKVLPQLGERMEVIAAERDQALAEAKVLRSVVGNEAWFGAWECGCTDTERTPLGIPEYCPQHGRKLISNFAGATKVQLNHSGVSGYGIKPGPPLGNPRSGS